MAKLSGRFEENADPKVQLEQAMAEAQEQHRRLVEQAASVIANQKADRTAAQSFHAGTGEGQLVDPAGPVMAERCCSQG